MKKTLLFLLIGIWAHAQQTTNYNANTVFEQMGTSLPTPNTYRTASGAPGKEYWQQKADYDIKVELDDDNQKITASEKITYYNASPDALTYLWLQLDQNNFNEKSDARTTRQTSISHERGSSGAALRSLSDKTDKEYGYLIQKVTDKLGNKLKYTINGTMMRVDLPTPLLKGQNFVFNVDWSFNIVDANAQRARSGYEYFEKDGNYLYEMAQWFPRMCVYDDVTGWQNKQFLGQGEFALVFGDYKVAITVPNDMVVGATGELQNQKEVLTATQISRLAQAENASTPVLIVNQSEAEVAEKNKPTGKKTWVYAAKNVRDFAFAASRKFIWDAMKVDVEGKKVWAMSLYPIEGNPLWGQYSTRLVAHTLTQYSKRTIPYPYPVAYSVHGPVGGMEYPMMSFNGARPQADGTYSEDTKNFLILVIIHEVGHNFFPMIVNSDERQWSWMDEGLNSFLEGIVCREWDRDFPADGIEPQHIVPYMKLDGSKQNSIMSSSDNILPGTFGPNAYSKPATGLNILRETVMGRELFDYAFKEYARRWAFKHPTPADFFRTMEDASAVDLDWFWKGWFYSVDALDQGIAEVEWLQVDTQNPEETKALAKQTAEAKKKTLSNMRNEKDIPQSVVEADPSMKDFYNNYDPLKVTESDKAKYQKYLESLSPEERKWIEDKKQFYVLKIKNKGGLVMPLIVQAQYEDGTTEDFRFPAEIWRLNNKEIKKTITTNKKVAKFKLDPYFELPDIDSSDNVYPKEPEKPTKFQLMKQQSQRSMPNPMQEARQNEAGAVGGSGRN
ncbi:M1 family metallopeptidase [Lacihabitans soyangensis]|uniref:M1 family peptidase n=1 Tax=Lacihabitans soyangensis TaxID=869394 RepID=A0AAE3H053_9BACT|nr:M1 family metallopeptidase [Lacihabitans soyangensis]MCP9761611.1 M1 family peptidase [Lacihabitans soyangensis]